jgi:hypothetical protein
MKKMNIMHSRKALIPIITEIIIILVIFAVSIVEAAWMESITNSFKATEQGQVTMLQFYEGSPGAIMIMFNNTGTSTITINQIWINNVQVTSNFGAVSPATAPPYAVPAKSGAVWNVTATVVSGSSYTVMLVSAKGNKFTSTGTPS